MYEGFVLWFTGMSGAGKSTLAQWICEEFKARGYLVELLDGDEVREHLSKGLTFSKEDRDTNVRRIGWVARVLARNGIIAITAAISPYADVRNEIRGDVEREGRATFVEVFVNAPLPTLVERDVKGLYKRALAGEIPHFTGVSDPYEIPHLPEVVVFTDTEAPQQSVTKILNYLTGQGLIERDENRATPFEAQKNETDG